MEEKYFGPAARTLTPVPSPVPSHPPSPGEGNAVEALAFVGQVARTTNVVGAALCGRPGWGKFPIGPPPPRAATQGRPYRTYCRNRKRNLPATPLQPSPPLPVREGGRGRERGQ